MEELYCFSDAVFHAPTPGVVSDDTFDRSLVVIGDKKGGLLATVALNDYLPYFTWELWKGD